MPMMGDFLFFSGVAFILLHEMDAVRCREWRIFPGLHLLNDRTGFIVFILAHIPLFVGLVWAMTDATVYPSFRRGFDIFLMIHLGLHLLFLLHKKNEFRDWISWTIIVGAAVCGVLDLWVVAGQ